MPVFALARSWWLHHIGESCFLSLTLFLPLITAHCPMGRLLKQNTVSRLGRFQARWRTSSLERQASVQKLIQHTHRMILTLEIYVIYITNNNQLGFIILISYYSNRMHLIIEILCVIYILLISRRLATYHPTLCL